MKFIKAADGLSMTDVARLENFSVTLKDGSWPVTAKDGLNEILLKSFDEAQEAIKYISELNALKKAAGKTACKVSAIIVSNGDDLFFYSVKIISAHLLEDGLERATVAVCTTLKEAQAYMEKLAKALEDLA